MSEISSGLSAIWWLPGVMSLPAWFIYRLFRSKKKVSQLQGKVVLITGASSGLGEALALVFYLIGCRVILASRRQEELERVRSELMSYRKHSAVTTYPPFVLTLDLSDLNVLPDHVTRAMKAFGHIDILINNGGISFRGDINNTNIDVDMKVMLVNYFGQVAVTKALLPHMINRRSGHIVAISSVQGRIALPYRSAYAASKHALQAFCDTLRAEVAQHNIKVTVFSPGYIQTRLSLNAMTGTGETYGIMDETTANGYTPKQVANRILRAIVYEEKEVVMASYLPRIAIWLRTLLPSLYFNAMNRRALKEARHEKMKSK
ncbi:unnamed protein product [Bemisia tabaci]|uniref:Dehydrogenase/reductase SDR family protein 7-like n=1 Tax=Bemisia tabaci TaxID=7038 RepID=A0A9P0EY67_BEMTA|nr:PREDICTED: dehydrogenase/reductase SDR family protein 7-like [Bemisia tabaci]CAH0380753.1 unnamed protein product [Bemisia tabaci]